MHIDSFTQWAKKSNPFSLSKDCHTLSKDCFSSLFKKENCTLDTVSYTFLLMLFRESLLLLSHFMVRSFKCLFWKHSCVPSAEGLLYSHLTITFNARDWKGSVQQKIPRICSQISKVSVLVVPFSQLKFSPLHNGGRLQ